MTEEQANPLLSIPVLVACAKTSVNHHLRSSLQELEFTSIAGVFSHGEALEKITETRFGSVFFDGHKSDMEPADFIAKSKEVDENCNLIVVAEEIQVEDVFELLRVGARGFIVPPFTFDAVEKSIAYAERVASISPDLLDSENVSDAVVEAVLNNFEALSRLMASQHKGASNFELSKMIHERLGVFRESADVAKAVLHEDAYVDMIIDRCIDQAKAPPTRLGRLRRRLKAQRGRNEEDENNS